MSKIIKYLYYFIALVFIVLTLFEIYLYLSMDASNLALFYLFLNFFVMFLIFNTALNYKKSKKNIRLSKNFLAIVIGLLTSFLLYVIIGSLFSYKDSSYLYSDKILIISKILKPIIYFILAGNSILDFRYN